MLQTPQRRKHFDIEEIWSDHIQTGDGLPNEVRAITLNQKLDDGRSINDD